ncbi:unnamed protein product [Rhodiola kirilowii]
MACGKKITKHTHPLPCNLWPAAKLTILSSMDMWSAAFGKDESLRWLSSPPLPSCQVLAPHGSSKPINRTLQCLCKIIPQSTKLHSLG